MSGGRYSTAMSQATHDALMAHLLRADGQEDLCFAVWYPSSGATRTTALVALPILPEEGDRLVHGNASFLPPFFERAVSEAMRAGGGLAFLHSHPGPGWQDMSADDVRAEQLHAAQAQAATGLPLVGLTLGTDGAWSARFWTKTAPRTYERQWCENVRVVGAKLSVTWHPLLHPTPRFRASLERTISAWGGAAQADLARLRIGVIGAGSVGSMVAEALARTGVQRIDILDFDSIEERNLDRLLHATVADIGRAKVKVLAEGLRTSATASTFDARAHEWSVVEEEGFRVALDCDVLFSCVDRPWPRSAMNFIAHAHLIPVVDGGIQVGVTPAGRLRRADWRAHVAAPGRRCLECIGQYDPGQVSAERDGYLDDPSYIDGLPADHPVKANENVFAFSLSAASLEVLQFLTMVIAPVGVATPGAQLYHFVPGLMEEPDFRGCDETCLYPSLTARGDTSGIIVTAEHAVAKRARDERARGVAAEEKPAERRGWWDRLRDRLFGRAA
jgi:molybdopterin-synthase adenylyltransferase